MPNPQLGAERPLRWDISVSRVGEQWKGNPKTVMKKVGFASYYLIIV
jgi:hypothetical protein